MNLHRENGSKSISKNLIILSNSISNLNIAPHYLRSQTPHKNEQVQNNLK